MRLALASDVHGQWKALSYPEADVLVLPGDLLRSVYGPAQPELEAEHQVVELVAFNSFLGQLKETRGYKQVVVVAGNHDYAFERREAACRAALTHAILLQNEATEIGGLKFYGSPWTPWFFAWAFNFPRPVENPAKARAHARSCWEKIPADTEVLITHGPPYGIRDEVERGSVGCKYLAERLPALKKLKLHAFGHIHPGAGEEVRKIAGRSVRFVNAAILNDAYTIANEIQVVEVA
jgi:Icc-related predicted phosphoesterase